MHEFHQFLDLNMGFIEQYAMVVKKSELAAWRKDGWLTCVEIGFPEEDAKKAELLYGEIFPDEILIFNRPPLLRDRPKKQLQGLTITGFCPLLGTYGMGGAGFFGLLLETGEYLTYAVLRAGSYVFVDEKVVETYRAFDEITQSWFGSDDDEKPLRDYLTGSKISDFHWEKDYFILWLEKSGQKIKVEFLRKNLAEKITAYEEGEITDHIVLQHENATLIV